MCLVTTSKKPKIAHKNIVCYKILHGNETPYINTKVSKLQLWGILPFRAKHKIKVEPFDHNHYSVGDGMIHTYQTKKEALRIQRCLNERFIISGMYILSNTSNLKGVDIYRVYKCIIPIGTRYYQDVAETYASRKIRFIKAIA